jgi:hypothetical protein
MRAADCRVPSAIRTPLLRRLDCDVTKGFATVARNNVLFLVLGALAVVVAVMGYELYRDRHPPEGLNINVGPGGLSIQGK